MASSMSCARLALWTLVALVLQILGLSLFVIGFFPVKPSLPGISGPESYRVPSCDAEVNAEEVDLTPDQFKSLYRELSKVPPTFDRLVLMVVDGLPAEFVLGRGDSRPSKAMMEAMPYTQSLLSKREAIAFHAKAAPPTVTMPRIKAMVSGAIGGFLDVAFNFNTQAFLDDNLLDQFYRIGWKLVMLGDNTWIKLFPGLFSRQDGVSSFFVKDTVEVDYNVTRHLEVELAADDWSLLILHYLGLDHVGHIGGRQSKLMAPKLNEMDEVVKMIHTWQVQDRDNVDRRTLLVVVSDHGMTDGGNHGGSTYEETDSLALFIGRGPGNPLYAPNEHNEVFQVDITPTLALLFGVPIPKNNIGVLLLEIFNTLTDEQKLRALELNSWQLLRLLRAHIRDLCCGDFVCGTNDGHDLGFDGSFGNEKEKFTHLFSRAIVAHNKWKVHQDSGFNNTDDIRIAVESYYDFLGNAREWLSHRATDKPIELLVSGICVMLISCILLISLLICFIKIVYFTPKQSSYLLKKHVGSWYLHEAFVFLGIFAHAMSLGASSMVEEEQYTWHYLTCSLYLLFLFTTVQSLIRRQTLDSTARVKGEEKYIFHQSQRSDARKITWFMDFKLSQIKKTHNFNQISCVIIVLICGRVLRAWHQGGVNWVHLPDISKWLEQSSAFTVKYLQITSLLLILVMSSFALSLVRLRRNLVFIIYCSYLACGLLVFLYAVKYQGHNVAAMDHSATFIAQIFYVAVAIILILIPLVSPWMVPVCYQERKWMTKLNSNTRSLDVHINFPLFDGIWDSTHLIGLTYCVCWCLLQLLLQQPVNAIPVFLLFLQLLASMIYFSTDESNHRQWIKVAAIYFLGMSGHFGLGNSNSLATVDVAGAFIGISSHSTILSGVLMFIITYASSILSFLSLIMCTSVEDIGYLSGQQMSGLGCIFQMTIALPCLIPLALNSIVLTTSTVILLFMRNHLFIWSVFSPKYLYVCAATLSVYLGVCIIATTGVYTSAVVFYRTKKLR